MNDYILEISHVAKMYDNGVVANSDVNFNLKKGEIHALVGENGAGKTTLMKMIFGMEQPSGGSIKLRGNEVHFSSSKEAIASGIGMVHQHFMLVESFTVAQNIVLGMEPQKKGIVDEKRAWRFTEDISEKYNLPVKPDDVVKNLSVGLKQKVEILKALARGADILILDEPTAVLAPQETAQLFDNLKLLKQQGHTIVFISHKIPEVKQISDRITVLRNGRTVGTFQNSDLTEAEISNHIMGCEMDASIHKKQAEYGERLLNVEKISYTDPSGVPVIRDISFSVRRGMIFGLAGVQGNGQVELVRMLTKTLPIQKGDIRFHGQSIKDITLEKLRETAFGYIPEDRMNQGAAGAESIQDNMIVNRLSGTKFVKSGILRLDRIRKFAEDNVRDFAIRCAGISQPLSMLSGGNMQKVVVARECGDDPDILICEQPTRGVDVGAAHIIHEKMVSMRDKGCAILLVTADLSELLKLADVVAVMYEGEIVGYFENTGDLNEEKLGLYMLGIRRDDDQQIGKAVNPG
ncbi:MAG: ABC transporter ATP-binding protein [Bacillota bacterium]|nr:ABC transporter ATP-binding protein [Bacillota bacterium]